jgi:osmoprotectant transport system substrate-binding protein
MRRSVALLAVLVTGAAWACGPGTPTVVVGSKNFTEQDVLGEIVSLWIERSTGTRVKRRLHLGGTFICHRALVNGDIDLYVEYTGTALTAILELPVESDAEAVYERVKLEYAQRFGIAWTEPLGFDNTFAILVRGATADSLSLRTISDATDHAPGWVPGFGYEFVDREDGLHGLERTYSLRFRAAPRVMDLGLTYRALAEGNVDLIAGNSTDGQIAALGLAQLADDRSYFPPYYAAPVVRTSTLERIPGLREALEDLGGRLDTETMRNLNRQVDVDGRGYRDVAREWVDGARP